MRLTGHTSNEPEIHDTVGWHGNGIGQLEALTRETFNEDRPKGLDTSVPVAATDSAK
jgi:hypothetical protein